jgi:hypothetical protein
MPVAGHVTADEELPGGDGRRDRPSGAAVTRSVPRAAAGRLADLDSLPTAHRAVLGHYAETGSFDYRALEIKSAVDDTTDAILADIYADCEATLADEFGVAADTVDFAYETKLTLPAELTLGYLYRRALSRAADGYDPIDDGSTGVLSGDPDPDEPANREAREYVERAEEATALIVRALLDGDMRDAINDDEFEDFEVSMPVDAAPRRVAECAQARLQSDVETAFDRAPDAVRTAYDDAVELSEAHQEQDDEFRALYAAARDGDGDARQRIEAEYKFAPFPDDPPFSGATLDLPYLKTQYDRVGVIYDGMLDAYRGIGFDIPEAFGTSIVLAIIGAQIWLDDVDDYRDDRSEGQLTPVTAEYVLAGDDGEAYENVVSIAERYFALARDHATEAGSTLNGIAIEYILRSGDPTRLPGAP